MFRIITVMLMNKMVLKHIITAIILLLVSADISYAEVMDKEPSIAQIYIYGLIGAALIVFTARLKPWLLLVVAPLPFLYFIGMIFEINDPYVGPAILNEAGVFYFISTYLITALLLVCVVASITIMHRKKT